MSNESGSQVRAELKSLHSPDVRDLERGPEDAENFGVLFQAMVGPAGEPGEESFDIMVCSPSWMAGHVREEGPTWGRHFLLMEKYDARVIEREIRAICDGATGTDWTAAAERLGRYGRWEFEDYEQ